MQEASDDDEEEDDDDYASDDSDVPKKRGKSRQSSQRQVRQGYPFQAHLRLSEEMLVAPGSRCKDEWPHMRLCWVQTPQLPPYQQSPYQQPGMYSQQPGMQYPQQPGPGMVPMPQPSYNGVLPSDSGPGVYEDTPDGYTRPGAGQRTSARGGRKVSYKVSAASWCQQQPVAAQLCAAVVWQHLQNVCFAQCIQHSVIVVTCGVQGMQP